jgi:hypothetical protein
MNASTWIPLLVAAVSGIFAVYAAIQARGTDVATRYYGDISTRIRELESENRDLRERLYRQQEETLLMKDRLRRAGIDE